MSQKIAVGTEVSFRFIGWDRKERTGRGVVAHDEIVGTDDAWTVVVTESPDYKAGEYVDIRARHVRAV